MALTRYGDALAPIAGCGEQSLFRPTFGALFSSRAKKIFQAIGSIQGLLSISSAQYVESIRTISGGLTRNNLA
jgi:hypothetical protein